jgi:hypothetical protein
VASWGLRVARNWGRDRGARIWSPWPRQVQKRKQRFPMRIRIRRLIMLPESARIGRSFGRSCGRSLGRSVVRSFGRPFGRSVVRLFGRSVVRSFGRSFRRSVGRSVGRSEQFIWATLGAIVVGYHDMLELGPKIVKLPPTIPMQTLITPLVAFGHFWSHHGGVPVYGRFGSQRCKTAADHSDANPYYTASSFWPLLEPSWWGASIWSIWVPTL